MQAELWRVALPRHKPHQNVLRIVADDVAIVCSNTKPMRFPHLHLFFYCQQGEVLAC